MTRHFSRSLFLLSVLVSLSNSVRSQPAVDVESVVLDKQSVFTVCPMRRSHCTKERASVKVTTTAKQGPKDNLIYYYVPSGGRIVGQGPSVLWDVSEAVPGTHSITVGVGTGAVIRGKLVTKTIRVEKCDVCDLACLCPSLWISGPTAPVKAGDAFIVRAAVGGSDEKITYQWEILGGTIVDGQKNAQILVKAPDNSDAVTTVTVEIGGTDPHCHCSTTASKKISIVK